MMPEETKKNFEQVFKQLLADNPDCHLALVVGYTAPDDDQASQIAVFASSNIDDPTSVHPIEILCAGISSVATGSREIHNHHEAKH